MPIIGYSPWQDAANFGQGVGNSLSESLLRLPMERYQLAQNAARMQQMQQLGLARIANAQERNQDLAQYHQGMLGLGQNRLQQQQQAAELLNAVRMLQAQNEQIRTQILANRPISLGNGSYLTPGSVGQPQDQSPQLPPMPTGIGNVPGLMGQPLQNDMPPMVPSPNAQQPQTVNQLGNSPTGWQLHQVPRDLTDYQKLMLQLGAARLGALSDTITNMQPYNRANISNLVQRANTLGMSSQQTNEQPNRVFNYNPQTGQLE